MNKNDEISKFQNYIKQNLPSFGVFLVLLNVKMGETWPKQHDQE